MQYKIYDKLFIGPMTKNVTDAIITYCNINDVHMGLIPSRRQIDFDGGYVGWNTKDFVQYVRGKTNNITIERDHSGIAQGTKNDNGILSQYHDAICNLDVIHVDPWKKYKNYDDGLNETLDTIKFINTINPHCTFEVGTEEAIRKFEVSEFKSFLTDLRNKLGDTFYKIRYAVIQSGTKLLETRNTGNFDIDRLKKMVDICWHFMIQSKEHNGDYLTESEIKLRFDNGLHAINIAPEYGVFETDLILKSITSNENLLNKVFDICYSSGKWIKWVNKDFNPLENKIKLIRISGHYVNKELKEICGINDEMIIKEIISKLEKIYSIWK